MNAVYRGQTDDLKVISYGTSGVPLSSILKTALSENWTDTSQPRSSSFLYEIQRALYGRSGVPSQDGSVIGLLQTIKSASTNNADVLNALETLQNLTASIMNEVYYLNRPLGSIAELLESQTNEQIRAVLESHTFGTGADEWNVRLSDLQLADVLSALGAVSNSVTLGIGDGFGALGGGTNLAGLAVSLGRLEEYVEQIRDDAETESLSPDSDAVEVVDDTGDLPATNAVETLVLPDPDLGDNTSVLDVLDTKAVQGVLPSLTGGDATLVVLGTQGSKGSVPYVEADLSLPPNVQRTMHAVAVWLWRLLFALGVWRIVRDEYAYWSTLGGSAVA